jgi:hypothetical protein
MQSAEVWIYIILGVCAIIPLRRLINSIREYRGSQFGMEKDNARGKIIQSSGLLGLLLVIGMGEFLFVTFAGNSISSLALMPTPTVDLQATETPGSTQLANGLPVENSTPAVNPAVTQTVTGGAGGSPSGGCIPGRIEWTEPKWGSEISSIVEFKGTANIDDFGFYYFEISQDNTHWTKHAAGSVAVVNGVLGNWNTTTEIPGDYSIRLIVTNNKGEEMAPCILQVKVIQK